MKYDTYRLILAIIGFFLFQQVAMAADIKRVPLDEENIARGISDAKGIRFDDGEHDNQFQPLSEHLSEDERNQIAKAILKSMTGGRVELEGNLLWLRYEKDKVDNRYVRRVVSTIVHRLSEAANARFEANAQKRVQEWLGLAKADRLQRIDQLRTQCQEHERVAAAIAENLRVRTDNTREQRRSTPQGARLRSQLHEAISKAFDCRLEYQKAQLANARQDIATAEARITRRQELRDKIIDRRVDELIDDEDTTWPNDWRRWPGAAISDRGARNPLRRRARSEESESKDDRPLSMRLVATSVNEEGEPQLHFNIVNETDTPYTIITIQTSFNNYRGARLATISIPPRETAGTTVVVAEAEHYQISLGGFPSNTPAPRLEKIIGRWTSPEGFTLHGAPTTSASDSDDVFGETSDGTQSGKTAENPLAMTLRKLKRVDSNHVTLFFAITNESEQPYVVTKYITELDGSYGGDNPHWPIGPGKTITTNIPVDRSEQYRISLRGYAAGSKRTNSNQLLAQWSSSGIMLGQPMPDAPLLKTVQEVEGRLREMIQERKAITNATISFRWRGSGSYDFNRVYSVFVNGQYRRSDCRGVGSDGVMDYTAIATPEFRFSYDRNSGESAYSARKEADQDVGWSGAWGDSIPNPRKIGWVVWNIESLDTHSFEEQLLADRRRNATVKVEEHNERKVTVVRFDKEENDKVKDSWGEYWLDPSQGNYPVYNAYGWTNKDANNTKFIVAQRTWWKQFDTVWFPQEITYEYSQSDKKDDVYQFELTRAEFNRSPFPDMFSPEAAVDAKLRQNEDLNRSNTYTTTASRSKPVFRGKSYDYWFRALQVERDVEILKQAMEAMRVLVEDRDDAKVAAAILRAMRIYGTATDGPRDHAFGVLSSLEPTTVLDAIVAEMDESNLLSRNFFFRYLGSSQLPQRFQSARADRASDIATAWLAVEERPSTKSDYWRIARIAGWGELKPETKTQLIEQLKAVETTDSEILHAVFGALANLSPNDERLPAAIISNEYLDMVAKGDVLSELGPYSVVALPQIIDELEKLGPITGDKSLAGRHKSLIRALHAIGPQAKSALPLLKRLESEAKELPEEPSTRGYSKMIVDEQRTLLSNAIREIEGTAPR